MFLAQLRNPVLPPLLGGAESPSTEMGGQAVGMLIGNFIGGFFIFAFILAFMYLLIGGISWITSGGDKAHLEEARNKITQAMVGLIIVAAAWAVMTLVGQFLGLDLQNITLPKFGG